MIQIQLYLLNIQAFLCIITIKHGHISCDRVPKTKHPATKDLAEILKPPKPHDTRVMGVMVNFFIKGKPFFSNERISAAADDDNTIH